MRRVASAIQDPLGKPIQRCLPAIAITAIALLALALRLHLLGLKSLWLDEGVSATIARLPWSDFFKLWWRREANMGFYHLLLRAWVHLSDSEFSIRLLSAICGVAAVIAVYALGKRLLDAQSGLIAALLLALNAFYLRYSQEARSYSLLILLLTLAAYFLFLAVEFPGPRNRRFYVLASVLAFYTHFFALLVTAAQLMWLALFVREPEQKVSLLKTTGWIGALCLPGIAFLLLKNRGQLNWIPAPTLRSLYDSFVLFTGQGGLWLVLAYTAICLVAVTARASRQQRTTWLLTLSLIFPIAALVAVSFIKPVFVPRYAAMCLPALVLLASAGLRQLKPAVRVAALALLVLLSSLGVRNYYRGLPGEDEHWREVANLVTGNAVAGDGLIFDNGVARPVFDYYRGASEWPQVIFPAHGERITYRDFEGVATPQDVMSARGYQRLWLVTRAPAAELQAAFAQDFQKLKEQKFPAATVQLYERRQK